MLFILSLSSRCLFTSVAMMLAAMAPCLADDDDNADRAESLKSATLALCASSHATLPRCKDGTMQRLVRELDAAEKAALAKARPLTVPLLKRDQVWFRQMLEVYDDNADDSGGSIQDIEVRMLERRIAALNELAQGHGRAGVGGRWVNAFGSVEVTPGEHGDIHVALTVDARYGEDSDRQPETCATRGVLRAGADGWLVGTAVSPKPYTTDVAKEVATMKPALLKIRRQGETLRVVAGDGNKDGWDRYAINCSHQNLLTGSYFAAGKSGRGLTGATPFVAPTFDCTRPATASEEEICADPELAAGDVRLNRAWHRLLPRLDTTTRRLLSTDQRAWVKSQAFQYPEFLHPAWDKQASDVHQTALARDSLLALQRERLAVLEGFDETRRGFEGTWWASDAGLTVTRGKDGKLNVSGGKWYQGSWKDGCVYEFSGTVDAAGFHADDKSENPDTLERDHATLIVNRADDAWAKRRDQDDPTAGEAKCRRLRSYSSTARLFPVRTSPDIGTLNIR